MTYQTCQKREAALDLYMNESLLAYYKTGLDRGSLIEPFNPKAQSNIHSLTPYGRGIRKMK